MILKFKIEYDLDNDCIEVKTYGKRKCKRAIENALYEALSVLDIDMAIDELDRQEVEK